MFSVVFAVFCAAAPVLLMVDRSRSVAVLVAVLVGGMWHVLWQQVLKLDVGTLLAGWRDWRDGRSLPQPPFTQPGSPAAFLSHSGGLACAWMAHAVWPANRRALVVLGGAFAGMWLGALLLGAVPLALCALACLALQLGLFADGAMARDPTSRSISTPLVNAALISLGVLLGRSTIATVSAQWLMVAFGAGLIWLFLRRLVPGPVGVVLWAAALCGTAVWPG